MNDLARAAKEAYAKAFEDQLGYTYPNYILEKAWDDVAAAVLRESITSAPGETAQDARQHAYMVAAAWMAAVGENGVSELLGSLTLDVRDGEPVFLLKGRDRLAPGAIRAWIVSAISANVPEWKIEEAERVLEAMERYPGDRKYPD